MKLQTLFAGAVLAAYTATSAHTATLGDPAAPLTIKEWIKGGPAHVKDGQNVYVVEFWATWCPPCRTSIPHLSKLQEKFKEKKVVFIGISDEPPAKVKPFVKKMAGQMEYVVACDDGRKSSSGYMGAYGQSGIPTAFVVGKGGKVLWFGHPMGGLEKAIEEIVDGKYDLAAAIRRDEARAAFQKYSALAKAEDPQAKALGQELLTKAGDDTQALCDLAFNIVARLPGDSRDFALANQALDQAEKSAGNKPAKVLGIRSILLFESGQQEKGIATARKAVELSQTEEQKAIHQRYVDVMERRMKSAAGKK